MLHSSSINFITYANTEGKKTKNKLEYTINYFDENCTIGLKDQYTTSLLLTKYTASEGDKEKLVEKRHSVKQWET